ncbi:MAG: hypothetical protein ACYC6H_08885 [Bellilinea sp.]|jgi:F0F1-type ATP synthase membrane subunit c/vacuolar-type H+-ATPase subunit K
MLERLHEHVVDELGQSSRTDTIFVVVAVIFNLIALGINSSIASSNSYNRSADNDIILVIMIVMTILVNTISILGLMVGRSTRQRLLTGLIAMYRDNQIDQYYDTGLVLNYGKRYTLFGAIIIVLAVTAILVPVILRLV